VFGTESTVKVRLGGVQLSTALLVRVSVSVLDWHYGKIRAGRNADRYRVFGEV
jgi:hypothetical protein